MENGIKLMIISILQAKMGGCLGGDFVRKQSKALFVLHKDCCVIILHFKILMSFM